MPTTEQMNVGFIGFGQEGAPIARAIADNGYLLHVWADRPGSLGPLSGVPNVVHSTVADLAATADVVGLFCNDIENQRLVDLGLLAALRRGSVLVNFANGLPEQARHLAELAAQHDVTFLDVPVSGGPAAAQARRLTAIAGGDRATVERLTPLFRTFAPTVVHIGPAGSGEHGKLLNNALMAMNHQNILEVLRLAAALKLPIRALLDVLRSGSAGSVALNAIGPVITAQNATSFRSLELEDMRLFAGAVGALGESAAPIVQRSVAGAEGLAELTAIVTG